MTLFGMEFTKFSLMGAAGMLVFGLVDFFIVNWALVQGERQAERDGTVSAEKTQAFGRVRIGLAVMCFVFFPVVGLLAGDFVIGSWF
ncbi:MAG: hypothetical protein AAF441_10760 [Pseudomonadota bacterium]